MPATELFLAIKDSNVAKAEELIQSGADPNGRGDEGPFPSDGGATCLIQAIRNFNVPESVSVQLLERGADPNLADTYDLESPLQAFARTYPYLTDESTALLNLLLDKGANTEQVNKHGDTALHTAASFGAGHVCVVLIKRGADIKAKDRKGKTVLEIAPDVATRSTIEEVLNTM